MQLPIRCACERCLSAATQAPASTCHRNPPSSWPAARLLLLQDTALPISCGQTMPAFSVHAKFLSLLEPHVAPGAAVLDLGAGKSHPVHVPSHSHSCSGLSTPVGMHEPIARLLGDPSTDGYTTPSCPPCVSAHVWAPIHPVHPVSLLAWPAGTGYMAACLAQLAGPQGRVLALEKQQKLVQRAQASIKASIPALCGAVDVRVCNVMAGVLWKLGARWESRGCMHLSHGTGVVCPQQRCKC